MDIPDYISAGGVVVVGVFQGEGVAGRSMADSWKQEAASQ
jgi:hypothetical protein